MLHLMRAVALLLPLCLASAGARADAAYDLVLAVQTDRPTVVKKMLAAGADPNLVDRVSGESLLIMSLREGAEGVFDVLMSRNDLKLELNAPNGNTALMMAAFRGNLRAVQALLAKGAIVTRPGWTALHYAAASGADPVVRLLLEHHAYIDAESPSQITPLMIAAREGQESTVDLLLAAGADATLKNNEALTAAQIAARADKPRIAAAIERHVAARKR